MSNKSKLYRSGCTPRVIFYSQTSKGHEYNYGKPLVTITGRNSLHIFQPMSSERKILDNIKHHPQPNSNRTLIPKYGDFDLKKINRKSKINYCTMDNLFHEKIDRKKKSSIKTSKDKNRTSSDLLSNFREDKKFINNSFNKNQFCFYIKNKYDYSSEIINLPGANKREINDIKDDYKNNLSRKTNSNSITKFFRERNINPPRIDCLCSNLKKSINRPFSEANLKTNYKKNRNNNILDNCSDLLYSSNNIFYKNNYYNNEENNNKLINKRNIANIYNKEINYINNDRLDKANYINNYQITNNNFIKRSNNKNQPKNNRVNKNEFINNWHFNTEINKNSNINQPINNDKIVPSNYNKVFKEKKNDLITHYAKRKNLNSFNKLFNEVHEQKKNYSLMNHYGKNYSKRNYSQIELH